MLTWAVAFYDSKRGDLPGATWIVAIIGDVLIIQAIATALTK